jgi:hypothetical protein
LFGWGAVDAFFEGQGQKGLRVLIDAWNGNWVVLYGNLYRSFVKNWQSELWPRIYEA